MSYGRPQLSQQQQQHPQNEAERRIQQLLAEREQLRSALEQERTEIFDLRLTMMSTEAEARHDAQKAVRQLQSQLDFQNQELKNSQRDLRTAMQQIDQLKGDAAAKLKTSATMPAAVTPTAGIQHAGSASSSSSKHRFPEIRDLSAATRSSTSQTPGLLSTPPPKRSSSSGSSSFLRTGSRSDDAHPIFQFATVPRAPLTARNERTVQLLIHNVLPQVAVIIRQLGQAAGTELEDQIKLKPGNAANTIRRSARTSEVKLLRSLPRTSRNAAPHTLTTGSVKRERADSTVEDALPIAEQLLKSVQQTSVIAQSDESLVVFPIVHQALNLFFALFNVQRSDLLRPLECMLVALVKCCQPTFKPRSDIGGASASYLRDNPAPVLGRLSFATPGRNRKRATSPTTPTSNNKKRQQVTTPGSSASRRKRSRPEPGGQSSIAAPFELDSELTHAHAAVDGADRYVVERLRKMLHKDQSVWQYEQYEDTMERVLSLALKFGHCRDRSDTVAAGLVTRVVLVVAEQLLCDNRPACLQSLLTGDNLALLGTMMRESHSCTQALLHIFHRLLQHPSMFTHLVDQRASLLWELTLHLQRQPKASVSAESSIERLKVALGVVELIRDLIFHHGPLAVAALGVSKIFAKTESCVKAAQAMKMTHTQCSETQTESAAKDLVAMPRLLLFALDCIRELDQAPEQFEEDSRFELLRQAVTAVMEILRLLSQHTQLGEIIVLLDFRLTGLAIVNRFLNQLVHVCLQTQELRADAETLELELNPEDDNDVDRLTQSVDMG